MPTVQKLWHNLYLPVNLKDYTPVFDFSKKSYILDLVENKYIIPDELHYFFSLCGLELMDHTLLFACQPGYVGFLHKDVHSYPEWNGKYCHCSVNIHLTEHRGCLEWFNNDNGSMEYSDVETPYEFYPTNNGHVLDSWNGRLSAAIVRTDIAHRANNLSGTGPRITATLRFNQNPDWEVAVDKLQNYIL